MRSHDPRNTEHELPTYHARCSPPYNFLVPGHRGEKLEVNTWVVKRDLKHWRAKEEPRIREFYMRQFEEKLRRLR